MRHLKQHLDLSRQLNANATAYLRLTPIPPPPRMPRITQARGEFAFGVVVGMLALAALRLIATVVL